MEQIMAGALLLLAAALVLPVIGTLLWQQWRRYQPAAPPGPPALPFVGHLHLLIKGPAPNILLANLSREYGPVMSLRFGSVPVVVASSRDAAKEFLKTHDAVFGSRPPTSAGRLLFYGFQDLGFAPSGDRWRQLRRLCTVELFSPRRIESFRSMRMDELKSTLRSLSRSSSVVDVRSSLMHLLFNIISQMLIGKRYFGEDAKDSSEGDEFIDIMHKYMDLCGAFSVGEYLPYLRWLDLDKIEARFKAASRLADAWLERIILEHEIKRKKDNEGGPPEDFVDLLVRLRDAGEEVLQGHTIKALLIDLLAAGSDTSVVTLEWALAELIKNPSLMLKVQHEISKVVGMHRLVEESDIADLPYLQAVLKETLRLHPAAALLIPHYSTEACTVMEYDIPKGTTVLVNVYAIGRDPALWKEPLLFSPERFINSDMDIRGQDFEVIPFGSGRRICAGMSLALAIDYVALGNLVHAFDWKLPPGEQVDTVNEKYGLTVPMAKKLEAIPVVRLPAEVFDAM